MNSLPDINSLSNEFYKIIDQNASCYTVNGIWDFTLPRIYNNETFADMLQVKPDRVNPPALGYTIGALLVYLSHHNGDPERYFAGDKINITLNHLDCSTSARVIACADIAQISDTTGILTG